MTVACWAAIGLASAAYGLAATVSTSTAKDATPFFAALAVAAWAFLAVHHHRRR